MVLKIDTIRYTFALQGLLKTPKKFKVEAIGIQNGHDFIGEGLDHQPESTIRQKSNYSGDKVAPQRIGNKKRFMEHFNIQTGRF